MIRKSKLLILLLFLIVLISSVSAIGAADSNATDVEAADGEDVELEQSDFNVSDVQAVNDEDVELGRSDSGQDVLSDGFTFADLNELINSSESLEITLPHGYTRSSDSDDYMINVKRDNLVIDGNGNMIYGLKGSNILGFRVFSKNVVIKNVVFEKMRSSSYHYNGAAIGAEDSSLNLTVINCRFIDCYTALDSGGAVANCARVENCTFTNCDSVYGYGGAVLNCACVENCNFTKCYSSNGHGGAVSNCARVENCNFTECHSGAYGGVAYGSFVKGCNFDGCYASGGGGATYQCSAVDCTFKNNYVTSSSANGGAMNVGSAVNCTFIGNRANNCGGALYVGNAEDCIFIGNSAKDGGAFNGYNTWYDIINCTFEDNHASNNYGASTYGSLVLCTFNDNNTADNNHRPYESNAVKIPNVVTVAASYEVYRPHEVSVPIMYLFNGGFGEKYYFDNVDLIIELRKNGQWVSDYNCISGRNWTQSLDKGSYSLWDKANNRQICTIEVYGYETIIKTANDVVMYVNDDVNLVVNLTDEHYQAMVGYFVYLKQGSTTLNASKTNGSGQATFSLKNIPAGVYDGNVYVEFEEDDTYAGTDSVVYLVVNKHETSINAVNVTAFYNEGIITAKLTDESGNPLTGSDLIVTVSYLAGESKKTNKSGEIEYSLVGKGLAEGSHTAKIEFRENGTHKGSNISINVNLYRLKSNITAENISFVYGESGILSAYLKDSNGDPISYYEIHLLMDSLYELRMTDSEGHVDFDLSNYLLMPGNSEGRIYFETTNRYIGTSIPVNVTVYKVSTEISAPDVTCMYGEGKYLVVTLKDKYGNPVANESVSIKSTIKTLSGKTDDNGQARFLIDLPPKSYSVALSFSGNALLDSTSSNAKVVVTQISEKISTVISAYNLVSVYNEGKYLTITLMDDYGDVMPGRPLSINFNGKTKTYKTDAKGQVKLSTASLVPKKYQAKITFSGDNRYKGSSFKVNLFVKKANPYLFVSKKKFNVKTSVKKYKVTLKTNKNVAMKNVKVYLKVKGKTYTVKTNKNGQAIFKLKGLSKKGTYKAVATYKGNSCYNKVSKNAKITVR